MSSRYVGVDVGAETIKIVELSKPEGNGSSNGNGHGRLRWTSRRIVEHNKEPGAALLAALADWGWDGVTGAAVSGRLSRQVNLPRVPTKGAQSAAFRWLFGEDPATVVSIGNHGFSVLELRQHSVEVFRENGRCSQGTGNFLRQLIERFDLTIEEASAMCADVGDPAPLSGRCPVILKTDMTHLANKGESRARILAGLYDAVCENVQVLIKPRISPPRVALIGGVGRSTRIRENFRRFLAKHEMTLLDGEADDALFFEALGCALQAAERPAWVPALDKLMMPPAETHLDKVPPLGDYLRLVKRMPAQPLGVVNGAPRELIVGFDIGSTGSKAVALDARTREVVWEGYLRTSGNPVGAAQSLMRQYTESPAGRYPAIALGVTGSGREIVGSLMATCYGGDQVFVLNEIAAHAEGALHFDPSVDTIFEIGGQDAKYIRLAEGRVIDAAMNEACSAGTGSFIEEQGKKFADVSDVVQLGGEALAADGGVSLGQHCSVFMAEIIDEAVATGVDQKQIIAGIYDSIIQNYLNRVKGSRSVGQVIFCQGMPFAADALATAVARQTGSQVVVPPNPGTVGALGIALLTLKRLPAEARAAAPVAPDRFLAARVERKDTFICKAVEGCGGAGNKCRIDRLSTIVEAERKRFTWGGGCSLWDKGTRKKKLPDRAPDPFRERQELVQEIIDRTTVARGRKRVGVGDEFQLKGLFPFFATFIHELGFDLIVHSGADHGALKRGIEEANVPFCAPMQQYHGLISQLVEAKPDYLFLPMLRRLPRVGGEPNAVVCPIVQGAPDILKADLGKIAPKIVSPVIDIGVDNFASTDLLESCRRLAAELGVLDGAKLSSAYRAATGEQTRFDARLLELGRQALDFCADQGIVPVVVLGRSYTIYNTVLNSNVPAILREQGAIAIPVDCYPVADDVPIFEDMFWGYGQRNLRAAHQIRRTPGIYSLYCSNYSCGPDSFTLHFYAYIMDGKPFAVIETDGHAGDAGTKTRVEAFLHCVGEDLAATAIAPARKRASSFKLIELDKEVITDIQRRDELVLIPRMGPGAEVIAGALRGIGVRAEALPMPDRESVRIGRRQTSGKECVPMTITTGSLLQRLARDEHSDERFAFFMPSADGPCRFGVYNLLHKIILERLGWKDRVRIWSPHSEGYFDGVPQGFATVAFAGFMGADLLLEALYYTRPVEKRAGAAQAIYDRYQQALIETLERAGRGDLSIPAALLQVANGRLFGVTDLLRRAAAEFAAVAQDKELPTVLVVGEIYVRCDPFSNDFIIEKLEQRGIRGRFAAFNEWIEYLDHMNLREGNKSGFGAHLSDFVRGRMQTMTYGAMADRLGWPKRTTVGETLHAAKDYLREDLIGEAVLTVGGPVHEWRERLIDGVVSVGPLECMPNKIAETQFFHAAEREGLLSLSIPLNGDPIDPEVVDNFAFEVHARWRKRREAGAHAAAEAPSFLEKSRRAFVTQLGKATAGFRLPPLKPGAFRLPVLRPGRRDDDDLRS